MENFKQNRRLHATVLCYNKKVFILLSIFVFIFGLLIGSFLNVVILRYNTGRTLGGRSFCFSCSHQLSWYELFPLFSFLFQKGKCRHCQTKISWQYPLVEALTGLIFLLIFNFVISNFYLPTQVGIISGGLILRLFFYWVIFSLLIVITVYDLKHKIIPNTLVYVFIFLALIFALGQFYFGIFNLWDLLIGPIFFLFFSSLWYFSQGRAMGFGDAKLVLGIGFLLGWAGGLAAIVLAFWIGAVVGLSLIIFSHLLKIPFIYRYLKLLYSAKKFTIKSEIPFGPFLILGLVVAFLLNLTIFNLFLF